MFEFIIFIGVILLFVYVKTISERISRLERHLKGSPTIMEPISTHHATQPAHGSTPNEFIAHNSGTDSVLPKEEVLEKSGLHTDLATISPTQWVAGIGALALLFGIGFFLRYAIDQGWLTEAMRVLLGVVVGLLLVALGELWHKKYTKYAEVLTGGGIAVLYFSIFASYQFYQQIQQPIAVLLMVLITVGGVVLSYRYNAKALAVLAVAGGYISPLLLHAGKDQHMSLFVYLTLLNLGVLVMLLREYWTELLYIALVGTGINFGFWAVFYSTRANTGASVTFLVLNFLLVGFLTAILFRKLHEEQRLPKDTDVALGVFYSIFGIAVFGTVAGLLEGRFHSFLAPVMLLLSVITFLSYVVIDRLNYNRLNYPLSFIGAKFLIASILWQFDGMTANAYLLFAGSIGVGVGFGVRRVDLRFWGLLVVLFSGLKMFIDEYAAESMFINSRFLLEMLTTGVLVGIAWGYEALLPQSTEEGKVGSFSKLAAVTIVWLAVSVEIVSHIGSVDAVNARNLILSIWWMAYAVLLAILGTFRGLFELRRAAVVLFGLTVLKVFLYDVLALDLGYRIVSFIVLGVILLSVSFAYQKNKEKLQKFWEGEQPKEIPNT